MVDRSSVNKKNEGELNKFQIDNDWIAGSFSFNTIYSSEISVRRKYN